MSQEKQSQKKIEELEKREQELKKIIDQARGDVESLSIEKMEKMKAIMSKVDKEDSQLDEEREYLNSDKTKGNDIKEIEESGNEKQHQEINSIRRKIQRNFYRQETVIGKPNEKEKKDFLGINQKLTKQELEMGNHLRQQEKADLLEEADNLLDRMNEIEEKEEAEREEKNKNEKRNLTKKVSAWLSSLQLKQGEKKEIYQPTEEELIDGIADLLKENKISEIIVSGGRKKIDNEGKIITWEQDLDSRTALWLLNDFNKKGEGEEIYKEGVRFTILDTQGREKEPQETVEGIRVFLDAGGTWLKIENGHQKTTTIHIDHHGAGQRDATSGTKMVYQIMEKADLLKDKPEWLVKFVNFVNEVDNLTYIEKENKYGKKIFNETYFRNEWPNSLYSLAEKEIPFKKLLELCQSEVIKEPSVPFTTKDLEGDIGKIVIGNSTIKELCEKQRVAVNFVIESIKTAKKLNEKGKLNLDTKSLGKIIYHNYPKDKKGKLINIIPNYLAFKATKARGFDTYISWNKKENEFFINSNNTNLSEIVNKLNEADPECAIDIRGVMVKGKIKNLTEEQFLNIIDPNILKGGEDKDTSAQEEEGGLTPEEEKILIEAEAQIKKEDEIISEAEKKIAELKSRLKVVEFKKKKEEQEKSKEKAKNKKIKKKQEEAGGEVKKEESEEIVTEESEIIPTEEVTGNEAKEIKKKIKPVPEDVEIETEEKIESFSTDFIKNKINELLLKIKQVKKINKLEIKGSNNNIEINTILRAKEGIISVGVNIGLVLTNKDENIVVKNYNIEAGALTSIIKPLITKQLDNVTELIKKYIEKERNKKVEKIWIEDGQLKVL